MEAEEAPGTALTPEAPPRRHQRLSPSAGAENRARPAVFSMETCVSRCSFPAGYFPGITSGMKVLRVGGGPQI